VKGVQAGAIFVDRQAKAYIEAAFRRAGQSDNEVSMYSKNGIADFEAHAKRTFRNDVDGQINLGNSTLTLTVAGVRRGRMTIPKCATRFPNIRTMPYIEFQSTFEVIF
jgi:hypothetical protein